MLGEDPTTLSLRRIEKRVEDTFDAVVAFAGDYKVSAVRAQVSDARKARDELAVLRSMGVQRRDL
jgi:hypothetical protein